MIEELELRNFKSILHDRITLGALTVLVGANGSGKSNLVKALEFVSEIPRNGLVSAVTSQGGGNGIVPKSVPRSSLRTSEVSISYRSRIPPPDKYPEHLRNSITGTHSIVLNFPRGELLRVKEERLTFNQVLALGEFLADSDAFSEGTSSPSASTFSLVQPRRGNPRFQERPLASRATLPRYLSWLGLGFLADQVTSRSALRQRLRTLWEQRSGPTSYRHDQPQRQHSFLDPDIPTILDFAPQFTLFRHTQMGIRRYDLLLNELRSEQEPSRGSRLTRTGRNMPSIVRDLSGDSDEMESWRRLLDTFSAIAPHIDSLRSQPLRTGKEFVEFIESDTGRGVESWSSSDGSLRALAILLAIETAGVGDTVVIEEPEQNLHPWAIRSLLEHVREAAEKRGLQVIITTHSQQVLERVDPSELRVVTRSRQEGTKFHRVDQILPGRQLGMGEVGDLWIRGLLPGTPADPGTE